MKKGYIVTKLTPEQLVFEEYKFNNFIEAGALGATVDSYNGYNFDYDELDFIHSMSISITQKGFYSWLHC